MNMNWICMTVQIYTYVHTFGKVLVMCVKAKAKSARLSARLLNSNSVRVRDLLIWLTYCWVIVCCKYAACELNSDCWEGNGEEGGEEREREREINRTCSCIMVTDTTNKATCIYATAYFSHGERNVLMSGCWRDTFEAVITSKLSVIGPNWITTWPVQGLFEICQNQWETSSIVVPRTIGIHS